MGWEQMRFVDCFGEALRLTRLNSGCTLCRSTGRMLYVPDRECQRCYGNYVDIHDVDILADCISAWKMIYKVSNPTKFFDASGNECELIKEFQGLHDRLTHLRGFKQSPFTQMCREIIAARNAVNAYVDSKTLGRTRRKVQQLCFKTWVATKPEFFGDMEGFGEIKASCDKAATRFMGGKVKNWPELREEFVQTL